MQTESRLKLALQPVVSFLDRSKTPYFIGGSVASSYHGASRSTLDVDLERQWNDLTTVAKLNAKLLDLEYLHSWSRTKGLTDLINRLLEATGRH
ncbi:MAG: hypothetical protein SFV81_11530 [Pirellulaceae bacterium]|nr:hypothetical protein [Pirellulaceae bacterium]